MLSSRVTTLVGLAVCLAACSTSAQPTRQAPSDTVATVGSTSITLSDVDDVALQQPAGDFGNLPLGQALYESRRAALDVMIGNLLIAAQAAALGVTREALVDQEISAHVDAPTEQEVAAWYQANPERVQGATLDQLREPIRQLLLQERQIAARRRYLDRLRETTAVRIMLEPPRVVVATARRTPRGPSDAPIEIIEFSDFECPFCQRAFPTVERVLAEYGARVRLVYRHYPLPNHPNARPSAEASLCAEEQDKFWEYHDHLFANPSKLTMPDLKQHAGDLGLDQGRFDACLESGKYREDVDRDIEAGNRAGVSGTPAFFINGRPLAGAQPFEAFERVIEEELERVQR